MNQLVVFDLDGTLIDSRTVMERAFRLAYVQEVGFGEPPLDQFFQWRLAQQVVRDPRAAVQLQQVVQRRAPKIEVGDQDRVVGQVRFGQRQVHGRE